MSVQDKMLEVARTHFQEVEQVADLFCDLDSDGMAEFFTRVARRMHRWPFGGEKMWIFMRESKSLKPEGRELIATINAFMEETKK